jgi:cytochrome b561
MMIAAEGYSCGSWALHWMIAVLVIGNMADGLLHDCPDTVINLMPLTGLPG